MSNNIFQICFETMVVTITRIGEVKEVQVLLIPTYPDVVYPTLLVAIPISLVFRGANVEYLILTKIVIRTINTIPRLNTSVSVILIEQLIVYIQSVIWDMNRLWFQEPSRLTYTRIVE